MTVVALPPGFSLELLQRKHQRHLFDCGQPEVNEWLRTRAMQHQDKRLSATKVLLQRGTQSPQSPINSDGRLTAEQFDALAADPVSYPPKTGPPGTGYAEGFGRQIIAERRKPSGESSQWSLPHSLRPAAQITAVNIARRTAPRK